MLRGRGFLVSWFLGCLVLGFLASWFQSFKDLQIVHFMLSEYIGPISKIFKILLDGSSGIPAPVFPKVSKCSAFKKRDLQNIIFKMI